MLVRNPKGHYHFLKGSDPYSCGVIADPRYEIVHVTLREPLQWRRGFDSIDAHLKSIGEDRHSLCGMELRSPAPFTIEGFVDFNRTYCEVLQEWDLYVDGENPVPAPMSSPSSVRRRYPPFTLFRTRSRQRTGRLSPPSSFPGRES